MSDTGSGVNSEARRRRKRRLRIERERERESSVRRLHIGLVLVFFRRVVIYIRLWNGVGLTEEL